MKQELTIEGLMEALSKFATAPKVAATVKPKKRITLDQVCTDLMALMAFGPITSKKARRTLSVSSSTLDRARIKCGIVSRRVPGKNAWTLYLPSQLPAETTTASDTESDNAVIRRSVLRLHDKVTALENKVSSFHEQLKIIGTNLHSLHADTKLIMREFVNTNPPPPELILNSRNGHAAKE